MGLTSLLAYGVLKAFKPPVRGPHDTGDFPDAGQVHRQLLQYFGNDFFQRIAGRTVLDFGCGIGCEAVEMARQGAARVIGVDIQPRFLQQARERAQQAGVADRCHFTTHTDERVDLVVSKDAFEHFSEPDTVLRAMAERLRPEGTVVAAFGPTWLHPYGGHLFSVFPWAHILFTEQALIRWRADFRSDGATCFADVEGGLNRMTIARFEQIVRDSPLHMNHMETVPIRGLDWLRRPMLREFGSSLVRCTMVANASAALHSATDGGVPARWHDNDGTVSTPLAPANR